MIYTPVIPDQGDSVKFTQRAVLGRRRTFEDREAGRLTLDLEYLGTTSRSQAAVANAPAIGKWARILLENPKAQTSRGTFTVSALYPHTGPVY